MLETLQGPLYGSWNLLLFFTACCPCPLRCCPSSCEFIVNILDMINHNNILCPGKKADDDLQRDKVAVQHGTVREAVHHPCRRKSYRQRYSFVCLCVYEMSLHKMYVLKQDKHTVHMELSEKPSTTLAAGKHTDRGTENISSV